MPNFAPNNEITIEEGTKLFDEQTAQAQASLISKGFLLNSQPPSYQTPNGVQPYRGELPYNLTELTDIQLGNYLGLLELWNDYVGRQLAEADIQHTNAKANFELIEAKLRIAYQRDGDGKKRSNPERDDYVRTDRRFVEAQSRMLYWNGVYTYIKAIANAGSSAWATVSRRITQRGQEIDRGGRQGSVNGHTNVSTPTFSFRSRNNG